MTTGFPARVPVSTYRVQMHAGFRFESATRIVSYLSRLGISELYSSPVLGARPGSVHGYDICDHARLNPEVGSEAEFGALSTALLAHGVGLLMDCVPNHMAAHSFCNRWWRDVLENGPSSPYARFFDIDWDPVKDELKQKILLPILGDQYGNVLMSGQLKVCFDQGLFHLEYFDHNLPLNPRQMRMLLRHDLETLEAGMDREDPHLREFLSILSQLDHMPAYTTTLAQLAQERHRESRVAAERLARLAAASSRIRRHIESNVRLFNGKPGDDGSFRLLHELLEAQAYRLSYWRTAMHEINYRRFFDINELAGLRTEDPAVFEETHKLVLDWVRRGAVSGLRLDHTDGLFNPARYFEQLQTAAHSGSSPLYILVEKILSAGETLPEDWTVHGTTGYEFLNDVNGLFVDSRNAQEMKRIYARFTGHQELLANVIYESKKLIITTSMASELNLLAHELNRISESNPRYRDFTLDSLQDALREVVACFPVYRTYFTPDGFGESDRKTVDTAVARALRRNPAMEPSIFSFICAMLLPVRAEGLSEDEYSRRLEFAMKFQQYTGPVQAKGLEDTAFYRYCPLLSLNEVGGDLFRFGRGPVEFHEANKVRLEHWPLSMLATSTHDTKRGEDARARINVLSELPADWRAEISRWSRANAGNRTLVHGKPAPDRNDEYLFYQALVGSWPPGLTQEPPQEFVDRMRDYMLKAIKEAKVHTSWIHPSEAYDNAVADFVKRSLTGAGSRRFLSYFLPFQQRVARAGMINSLAQVTLKIASPGVPDFYQGSELWNLSLVDPDNRRPVDFETRRKSLEDMEPLLECVAYIPGKIGAVSEMLERWEDGRIKLYLTAAALRLRRRFPGLFLQGAYVPLEAVGDRKDFLVAFARRHEHLNLIVVVPRLVLHLTGPDHFLPVGEESWGETTLPVPAEEAGRTYTNLFTGEQASASSATGFAVADLLRTCPVAMLLAGEQEDKQ